VKRYLSINYLWLALLLVANLVYLAYELSFNSRIVDSATGGFSQELIDFLEVQGRLLSGVGLSLLLLRFLPINPFKGIKQLMLAVLVFVLAIPTMYYAQEKLVNTLVISSTGEDRLNAKYLSVLKVGIANNSLQLDDISIPEDELDTPATKTFLHIVPGMIFSSPELVEYLKGEIDKVIDQMAERDSLAALPEAYENYRKVGADVVDGYSKFDVARNRYLSDLREALLDTDAAVDGLYKALAQSWVDNQASGLPKPERIRKSLEIKRSLDDYFASYDECMDMKKKNRAVCMKKLQEVYNDTVTAEVGRYVAPDYWCFEPQEKMIVKKVRGVARQFVETVQDCRTMPREFLEDKMMALFGSGPTFEQYLALPQVKARVEEELKSQSLEMPSDALLADQQAFKIALRQQVENAANTNYRHEITREFGEYLHPEVDAEQYLGLTRIQAQLRRVFELPTTQFVRLDWEPTVFNDLVLIPKFIDKYQAQKRELMLDANELADGGAEETLGQNLYRALVVPPIAMGFSLFFGLLNLFGVVATLGRFVFRTKLASLMSYILGVLLFFAFPVLAPSATVDSKAFNFFQSKMDETLPGSVSAVAAWVVDAQPLLYPLGSVAASVVNQAELELKYVKLAEPIQSPSAEAIELASSETSMQPQSLADTPASIAPHSDTVEKSQEPNESVSLIRQTFSRSGVPPTSAAPSFSLAGMRASLASTGTLFVDLSPIGASGSDFVIYDKPFLGDDVCLFSKTPSNSLYDLTLEQWLSGVHGSCSEVSRQTHLPTLERYLAMLERETDVSSSVMFNIHIPITDVVYCNDIYRLVDRLRRAAQQSEVAFTTSFEQILACYAGYPSTNIRYGFMYPGYSSTGSFDDTKRDHAVISRAEYKRVKGEVAARDQRVNSVPVSRIEGLLKAYPGTDFILLDEQHVTPEHEALVDQQNIELGSFTAVSLTLNRKIAP